MSGVKAILTFFAFMFVIPVAAQAADTKTYEQMVEGIDAVQAMALANQWKWTRSDITTHVTSEAVFFEFPSASGGPGGTEKKVPLPEDKMVVAIAPYLTYTHG